MSARRDVRAAAFLSAALVACLVVLCPAGAQAARGLQTGFADPFYTSGDAAKRTLAFDETVTADAQLARINLLWRFTAPGQPANPRNPADPAYNFAPYDVAIRDALARGVQPVLTIYRAPDWAEGAGRPAGTPAGSWRPRPDAYADFAYAVAQRYSGTFADAGGSVLPRVHLFQAWNEPNLTTYLNPQYEGGSGTAPVIYRELLNAFYGAVKSVAGDNLVVTAGMAPYGDPPGGVRYHPLAFWRDVFCLSADLQPLACPVKAAFDILAHHPINTSGGPRTGAINPDDISTPDLHRLVDALRVAEARGQIATGGAHPVWATEIWWDSDPPDTLEGIPLMRQARYLEEALYVLWKQGASAVINLQVRDAPFTKEGAFGDDSTGVFFNDGSAKPSLRAFRFPFVSERKTPEKLTVWGRSPLGGKLKIQRNRRGKWRKVKTIKVAPNEVFKRGLKLSGHPKLRATVGGETSLTWTNR